jgi:hypothetical protein
VDHLRGGPKHRSSRCSSVAGGSTSRAFFHGPCCPCFPIRSGLSIRGGLLVPRPFRVHLALLRTAIPIGRWRHRRISNSRQRNVLVWGLCNHARNSAQERQPSIVGEKSPLHSESVSPLLAAPWQFSINANRLIACNYPEVGGNPPEKLVRNLVHGAGIVISTKGGRTEELAGFVHNYATRRSPCIA